MLAADINTLYYTKKASGYLTERRNLSHNKNETNTKKDMKNPFANEETKSKIMLREPSIKQNLNKSKLQYKAQQKSLLNKKEKTISRLQSHNDIKDPINLNSNDKNSKGNKEQSACTNRIKSKLKISKLNTDRLMSSKGNSFSSEQQVIALQKSTNKERKKNLPSDVYKNLTNSVAEKYKAIDKTEIYMRKASKNKEVPSKSKVYETRHVGKTNHSTSIDNGKVHCKFSNQIANHELAKEGSTDTRRSVNTSKVPLKRNPSSAKTSLKMVTSRLHSKSKCTDKNTLPATIPLSKENLEKFERIRGGIAIINIIKEHFKKHGEAPATKISFYRIGRLLGKGAFGKVNLGMHKLTGKYVAIKSIKKSYLDDKESKNRLVQEFTILKNLNHPNICRLYESFENEKHVLIVTELCSGQDLLNYIRKYKKLNEDTAKFIFKALISGLHYCHIRGIIHRDIKLDNLLLTSKGELKICDFGVSRVVSRGEVMTERCGTPAYMAPEILRDKGYKGFGVDMWSAGVALYAMLYGTVPFKATTIKELHKLILKGKIELKDDISEDARDLLRKLLERNSRKRINTFEVLQHSWMQNINNKVSLFTKEEQESFDKDCWQNTELFTEQDINSTLDDLNKNNTTKSIILAPFNTTLSQELEDSLIGEKELVDKVMVMKFSSKAKDIDRQYEKNNNGDIDNGIYTKFLASSSKESEGLIADESYSETPSSSKSFIRTEDHKETITNCLTINQSILTKMESYGYRKDYVTKCLRNNELNHATATYYLFFKSN